LAVAATEALVDVVGGLPKRLGAGEVERHGKTETYDDPRFSLHEMVLNPVLRGQEASIINFQLQILFPNCFWFWSNSIQVDSPYILHVFVVG
jgi:hypothetical protein